MSEYQLNPKLFDDDVEREPIRNGFGRGLKRAGEEDAELLLCALICTESTQIEPFKNSFPDRFIEIGIAEQNLVTVASGMTIAGKIPFASSYAAFNPGRNWEQIKTTIALNDQPVKIVGGHAGVSVGPDGATHQMLEDISLMRSMPNMIVIIPGDSIEAEKVALSVAKNNKPTYIRLNRPKVPIFSTQDSPFEIGKAYILRDGIDVSLFGTGSLTYQLLVAAKILSSLGIEAEVIHVPTIKPLDDSTILDSAKRTGRVVSAEEAQIIGGLGGAIAELLSEELPTPLMRIGVQDRYGESGEPDQLFEHFGFNGDSIAQKVANFVRNTAQYHRDY